MEALKANDNDLYYLLRTQWAHRFGVESLEELKNPDLKDFNQNLKDLDNQKIKQLEEKLIENDKQISKKELSSQEKEMKTTLPESINNEDVESFKNKDNLRVDKVMHTKESVNSVEENKYQHKVETLIPLPPKPKYSYLKKWLL